ncbi:hypothetical protein BST61_g11299 [Cercospora zeina]
MPLSICNYIKLLEDQVANAAELRRICIVSSYITTKGLEQVLPVFSQFSQRGAKIQLATTFRRGITQVEAIEWLARLPNTELYIFWNDRFNFHAKYSLFLYKNYDFDTAILGSSNLTITDVGVGVEANVLLERWQGEQISNILDDLEQEFERSRHDHRAEYCWIRWDPAHADHELLTRLCSKEFLMSAHVMDKEKLFATPTHRLSRRSGRYIKTEWNVSRNGTIRPFFSVCDYKSYMNPDATVVQDQPTDLDRIEDKSEAANRTLKWMHARSIRRRLLDAEAKLRNIPSQDDEQGDAESEDEETGTGEQDIATSVISQLLVPQASS